jgi:hypothetical protein
VADAGPCERDLARAPAPWDQLGSATMSDSQVDWWMDASCRWHQGRPPPGWWQAGNGRWHPPGPDATTEGMTTGPPVAGAHLGGGGRGPGLWEAYRSWPRWARVAAPLAAFVLAIGVLGAAAIQGLRGGDPDTTAADVANATSEPGASTTAPDAAAPAPTAPTTRPTTTTDSTTDSMPSTTPSPQPDPSPTAEPARPPSTSPDPTNNDIHPGAPCSPEGATALSGDGVPLTCTTQKCHGAPFGQPRWRRTAC